jgi:SAM-dependent methyltransferase
VSAHAHWDEVYGRLAPAEGSWYEPTPSTSLELTAASGVLAGDPIIDIGGGRSFLVDELLARGFHDVSVLDISAVAIAASRARLGARADAVHWIRADLTAWVPDRRYRLWHDRAVFHFLVEPRDQERYARTAAAAIAPGGGLILATFAADGPTQCSGLPVARWGAHSLAARFAPDFSLQDSRHEEHVTPSGRIQPFTWILLKRCPT